MDNFITFFSDRKFLFGSLFGALLLFGVMTLTGCSSECEDADLDTDVEDTDVEDTDVEDTDVEDTDVEDTDVEDTGTEDTDVTGK